MRSTLCVQIVGRLAATAQLGRPFQFGKRYAHTVKDILIDRTPITAQLWQMRRGDDTLEGNDSSVVVSKQALVPRTSDQSRLTLRYNFSSDSHLRDLYADHTGNILTGKLFEDLDALAGNVANRHCCDENLAAKRLALVTASVEEIIQSSPIPISDDLILTGKIFQVSHLHPKILYPTFY